MPHSQAPSKTKTVIATLFALTAFAGNSVLCRLALLPNMTIAKASISDNTALASSAQAIDATSFTVIRLLSGSIALFIFMMVQSGPTKRNQVMAVFCTRELSSLTSWLAPFCLFVYAACFSFAYITLPTGAGALVLFGCVQLTMIISSILAKEALNFQKYFGVVLAFLGLCLLMYFQGSSSANSDAIPSAFDALPRSSTQTSALLIGFLLMVVSGVAWAIYTLLGRSSLNPIADTCTNFIKSLPFCALLCLLYVATSPELSPYGLTLALLSGIVTSALGYAVWYYVLPQLSRIQAGVVQLLVPVIAAVGGFMWAQEAITLALIVSQIMVLGGIALVMFKTSK